jgi:putative transposon-encoded protein
MRPTVIAVFPIGNSLKADIPKTELDKTHVVVHFFF